MKTITLVLFLFSTSIFFSQETKRTEKSNIKVTSISYMVNNLDELENLDWKDVREVFKNNQDEEIIEMSFGVDFKKSKHNLKSSIKVSGETKNLDSLIIKLKKGIKAILKISKKYQN